MPRPTPLMQPITPETAVIRLATTAQALIDSWHKGRASRPIDDTWIHARMSGYEYALGLLLDVPGATIHDALMSGSLPPSAS